MVVVCGELLGWIGKIFVDIFGMRWVPEIGCYYWYGDQSLKEAFPVLYEIATD